MKDEDLKKIVKEAFKEDLRSVKELAEIIKQKVEQQELFQHVTMENVRSMKDQQSVMNEKLDGLRENLDDAKKNLRDVEKTQKNSVLPSVIYIEKNIKAYADSYKISGANIRKIQKRLETVEEKTGTTSSRELYLIDVQ